MNEATMPIATVKTAPVLAESIEAAPVSAAPPVELPSVEVPFMSIPPTAWAEVGDLFSVAFLANFVYASMVLLPAALGDVSFENYLGMKRLTER